MTRGAVESLERRRPGTGGDLHARRRELNFRENSISRGSPGWPLPSLLSRLLPTVVGERSASLAFLRDRWRKDRPCDPARSPRVER
jgi:hypothetical protein